MACALRHFCVMDPWSQLCFGWSQFYTLVWWVCETWAINNSPLYHVISIGPWLVRQHSNVTALLPSTSTLSTNGNVMLGNSFTVFSVKNKYAYQKRWYNFCTLSFSSTYWYIWLWWKYYFVIYFLFWEWLWFLLCHSVFWWHRNIHPRLLSHNMEFLTWLFYHQIPKRHKT